MNKLRFTVTGYYFYDGIIPFEENKYLKLIKEPDNDYDHEAIKIEDPSGEKVGYVANSTNTVIKETMSAGRIYDKIEEISYCKVNEINSYGIICEIVDKNKVKKKSTNKIMKKIKSKFFKNNKKLKENFY
ncbi:MAG: HIRAN domain-containing protein [Methanobrevibacter arboriphilus]|uniref:HIRAN domain-containing protein n=1 Tax=Methanobrevibacter arboriphilus TaxID=39441 RepID=A0A843ABE8_METAZ|nr:HIRAN domain-containing protein [Methanobrevibacter arboriphilus]MBF4468242.1 HIRAN domain-containing protein [Methanobrevibacter arboriphilus]